MSFYAELHVRNVDNFAFSKANAHVIKNKQKRKIRLNVAATFA